MPACVTGFTILVDGLRKIPVDEHSVLNLRFGLIIMRFIALQFHAANDQYVPGADVSMKDATLKSGFVSCNVISFCTLAAKKIATHHSERLALRVPALWNSQNFLAFYQPHLGLPIVTVWC
jgi:hypothetical protein